jgi:hypothetical protein
VFPGAFSTTVVANSVKNAPLIPLYRRLRGPKVLAAHGMRAFSPPHMALSTFVLYLEQDERKCTRQVPKVKLLKVLMQLMYLII